MSTDLFEQTTAMFQLVSAVGKVTAQSSCPELMTGLGQIQATIATAERLNNQGIVKAMQSRIPILLGWMGNQKCALSPCGMNRTCYPQVENICLDTDQQMACAPLPQQPYNKPKVRRSLK